MQYLIILSRVSLNEPTKETSFSFFSSNRENLVSKINNIKNDVISQNKETYTELIGENCPYHDGYISPKYKTHYRISGIFSPLDDGEVFLIEEHTSYFYAYAVTIRNFIDNNEFILYEH